MYHYDVKQVGDKFHATIFEGVNVIETIEAATEKQAHYLAKNSIGEKVLSPTEMNKLADDMYNSKEGRRYRAMEERNKSSKQ
jgi:hypothetical protein